MLFLSSFDLQVEYIWRLDYLMKQKLKEEQEEARSVELVNRMLLFNILPPHVAKYYLAKQLEEDSERVEVRFIQLYLLLDIEFNNFKGKVPW